MSNNSHPRDNQGIRDEIRTACASIVTELDELDGMTAAARADSISRDDAIKLAAVKIYNLSKAFNVDR